MSERSRTGKVRGRACDACSVRKIRCDGRQPCRGCESFVEETCTYLRRHGKSGPKGPRRTTADTIRQLQAQSCANTPPLDDDSIESPIEFEKHYQQQGSSSKDVITTDRLPSLSFHQLIPTRPSPGIPVSVIVQCVEMYHARAHTIWPVVDASQLLESLRADPESLEVYALATAFCGAVMTQFQINVITSSDGIQFHSSVFSQDADLARFNNNYMERVTVESLLSSFFLHVYKSNVGRTVTSTVLLSEAITFAHVIGLHTKSFYDTLPLKEQQFHVRIYWLLFITERAHSIQNETAAILKRASDLPPLLQGDDQMVSDTFIQLCILFCVLDETVNFECAHLPTREALALAQREINQDLIPSLLRDSELQRADIFMTQQWMRILLWQQSLAATTLHLVDQAEEFSLSFPTQVAKSALDFVASLSEGSLESHGPGMETKLYVIANALVDVIICAPSSMEGDGFITAGSIDSVYKLLSLLSSFRGGNSKLVSALQEKLASAGALTIAQHVD